MSQSFDYQFLSIGSSAFQCSLATEGLRLRSVGGGGGRSGRLWCDGPASTRINQYSIIIVLVGKNTGDYDESTISNLLVHSARNHVEKPEVV